MSLVKAFSKMLDSIPHDQMFTQMVLSQIVTYYDKCCGWYKGKFRMVLSTLPSSKNLLSSALVSRVSTQASGGVRLKAAAAFADSGAIHDTVQELWTGTGDKKELIDKVSTLC
jgi:hypothetical protein